MSKKISFTVKLRRPVCRTPIKPVQAHKNDAKYSRKTKYKQNLSQNDALGD